MFCSKIEGVTVSETFPLCITALHTYFDLLVIYMHDWLTYGWHQICGTMSQRIVWICSKQWLLCNDSFIHELCISYFAKAKVRTGLYDMLAVASPYSPLLLIAITLIENTVRFEWCIMPKHQHRGPIASTEGMHRSESIRCNQISLVHQSNSGSCEHCMGCACSAKRICYLNLWAELQLLT